jgi:predicted RNase H-like nuclease
VAIAIDIPIGLSDAGPRRCDALARRRLPGRSATVFNAPPRACLDHVDDYPGANARARQAGDQGLSRQSFGLLAKIREVDEFWPEAPGPIYEVHPELSFARLNGGVPLAP